MRNATTSAHGGFRVYAIELSDDAGPRLNSAFPNVYVGQTNKSPEQRFAIHKAGGFTASRVVERCWVRLMPELYDRMSPVETRAEVLALEHSFAALLRIIGYIVHGGQGQPTPKGC